MTPRICWFALNAKVTWDDCDPANFGTVGCGLSHLGPGKSCLTEEQKYVLAGSGPDTDA